MRRIPKEILPFDYIDWHTCSILRKANDHCFMMESPAGCSKRLSGKAAADGSTGGVAPGYVEDAFEGRTQLADFFSILLIGHLAFLE
jgi:hypothetical protein